MSWNLPELATALPPVPLPPSLWGSQACGGDAVPDREGAASRWVPAQSHSWSRKSSASGLEREFSALF